jgi:hypothetical protein
MTEKLTQEEENLIAAAVQLIQKSGKKELHYYDSRKELTGKYRHDFVSIHISRDFGAPND